MCHTEIMGVSCPQLASIYLFLSIDTLVTISNVEEIVLLMMFLVEGAHSGTGGRDYIVDKEEECIFRSKVDPLANEKVELANRQVRWNQVFLLVQVTNPCFWGLLHNNLISKNKKSEK